MTSSEYNATLDKAAGANLQGAVFEIYDPFTYVVLATIETDSYGVAASTAFRKILCKRYSTKSSIEL